MSRERADEQVGSGAPAALTSGPGSSDLLPDLRLQILATEHWSLLSTHEFVTTPACSRR
jgi:hypothetical protein